MADQELVLIGVASNGKLEQWDGLNTPAGILLRWFQGDLGFPGLGYDIYRAAIVDKRGLDWDILQPAMQGQTSYAHHHDLVLTSTQGFQFTNLNNSINLCIVPQDKITLAFTSPAWFARLEVSPQVNTDVLVSLMAGGKVRETRRLTEFDAIGLWRTRGIDCIEIIGSGACLTFSYQLISSIANWTLVHHTCLPVTDPAYAGGSNWIGSDEDEAKRRLPQGADWAGHYQAAFAQLYPYLREIAQGKTPTALPPSTTPQSPAMNFSTPDAIQMAALNPHVARMLGLAWDDPLLPHGLDNKEYAYKVVGRWPGAVHLFELRDKEDLQQLDEHGISLSLKLGTWAQKIKPLSLKLAPKGSLTFQFKHTVQSATLVMASVKDVEWEAFDSTGASLGRQTFKATRTYRSLAARPHVKTLTILGEALLQFKSLEVADETVERTAMVPNLVARDPGPPKGPAAVQASAATTGFCAGSLEANVYWDLPLTPNHLPADIGCVFYQLAGFQAGDDPNQPAPSAPPFNSQYLLLNGEPMIVSPHMAAAVKPRFYTEGPLNEGWRCWWVRGLDFFGRVSRASAPAMVQLMDQALPPAPPLVLAEYVQGGLLPSQQGLAGYSLQGRAWLDAHPGHQAAVVVSWAWTPELAFSWPDVDGFKVQVRRPQPLTPRGPQDPETYYPTDPASWGPVRADWGPFQPYAKGSVTAVVSNLPDIVISSVTPVARGPEEISRFQGQIVDDTLAVSECQTDLTLDFGQGVLLGAVLEASPMPVTVVGHGQGAQISILVEHPAGRPPVPGTYTVRPGTTNVFSVYTTIQPGPLDTDPFQQRLAGVIAKDGQRWAVLHMDNGRFLCTGVSPAAGGSWPAAGDDIVWCPAYLLVIPDQDFGPKPMFAKPMAHAQVTVRSIRRWGQQELMSLPGQPGLLTGVDCTPPAPPALDLPPNIGPYCAQAATRPDWYGISRFTLNWQAQPDVKYVVYRALSEAIFTLDRQAYIPEQSHPFPNDLDHTWHPDVLNEIVNDPNPRPNRIDRVQADFELLHAALSAGDDKTIRRAYRGLHLDTQRLLASQACTEAAYAARHGEPLDIGSAAYTDEFDGRPRAHWFYRVAARSASGLESPKSAPTPPICCPDVVAPAAPLVQMALAAEGKVRLQWQASFEEDLKQYRIYRAQDETSAADVRSMQEVALLPAPDAVPDHPTWRQYEDPAPLGRESFYRIAAEDDSGNCSAPSAILRGRPLLVLPIPPIWNTPERMPVANPTKVLLSWTHVADQRLACRVERRVPGGGIWQPVCAWLPRGEYQCEDLPPKLGWAWEYRVWVKDHQDQICPQAPIAALPRA